jgi:hypothetical protein
MKSGQYVALLNVKRNLYSQSPLSCKERTFFKVSLQYELYGLQILFSVSVIYDVVFLNLSASMGHATL